MPTPTILVPKEKSKHTKNENDKTPANSTAPDSVTLDMGATDFQEIHTQDPNTNKEGEQKEGKDPNMNQDYVVYQYLGSLQDPNSGRGVTGDSFVYEPSRNVFVRLVLSIVLFMLLCTVGFNLFVHLTPPVFKIFQTMGIWFLVAACIVMLGLNYAMACSKCATVAPCSYFCLGLAVVCMSVITAWFTVKVRTVLILYALIATVITVFICVLVACSSLDFTKFYIYIIVAAAVFASLSMIVLLGMLIANVYIKPLHLVILFLGTLLNVVILIMELQMIIGGKTIELGEDEYAIAAYMVYTSVVDIFIRFLLIGQILDT